MKNSCRMLAVATLSLIMMLCVTAVAFAEQESGWKPSENQDKYEGIEYGLGMFSAAAKGTDIVINDDGTVTLNVTTKPMTSTKYTKVAFSQESLTDNEKKEQAAAGIPVTIGSAEDYYVNPFNESDKGMRTYYWSIFSYTMPVESLKEDIYTAGFNVLRKENGTIVTYEGVWAYNSTWTVKPTPELVQKLRSKQAELGESEVAARIGQVAEHFEDALFDEAKAAISAAKANLSDKSLIEAALKACECLTNAQKAEIAEDIKTLNEAKDEIERKEREKAAAEAKKKAEQKAIKTVKATKITGLKVKPAKKKMTISWRKNTKVFAGYQIQYKKAGAKAKTIKITKATTVKKVIKKLKSKKKYTVKVRGYKKIAGAVRYGKWSASKTVKIK